MWRRRERLAGSGRTGLTRRTTLAAAAFFLPGSRLHAADGPSAGAIETAMRRIAAIEQRDGGRLGVAVLDTATGIAFGHRADERFPMCSTYKFLAAAAVLSRVDAGSDRIDRMVAYRPDNLGGYSPVTRAHVAEGGMTLGDLCSAAVEWSDNTAGNLLLRTIGGPAGFTRYVRTLGDTVTRLDRIEPTLNTAIAGDERDTTSPAAMLRDLRTLVLGQALRPDSRRRLESWIVADKMGEARIRAGVPRSWRVGDKTGTGDNGTSNTIAILWPPEGHPVLAAVYDTGSSATDRDAVHAETGRIVADAVLALGRE